MNPVGTRYADMPIRHKILIGLGFALLPALLALCAGVWAVDASRKVHDNVTVSIVPELMAVTDLREKGLRLIDLLDKLALVSAALHADPGRLSEAVGREQSALDGAAQAFATANETLTRLSTETEAIDVQLRTDIGAAAADLLALPEQVVSVLRAAPAASDILRLRRQFKDRAYEFRKLIDAAVAHEKDELAHGSETLSGAIETALAIMAGGVLLVLAACLLSASQLSRRIVRPLLSLRDAAQRLGQGDFDTVPERTSGDEVGELVESFRSMSGQLRAATGKLAAQERMAAIGQVAGVVSHELRNPLATIRNSVATLRQKTADRDLGIDKVMQRIDRAIERCDVIVSDLLEFFRDRKLERTPTRLDQWLLDLLAEHGIPSDVTVVRELASGESLSIDPNRFRQVIVNLVDNAVQAMKDPSRETCGEHRLTIRTATAGPFARIAIADNGPGIAPETLARIFEPLFTTKSFGVGLGLPTVRKLIEQHGGTIDVESTVGVGTTFTIFLPRLANDAEAAVPGADTATKAA